ncbi:MAG: Asp-tRNA(Asn)/Glu-tRNA(Gln) amidotransferase subunit GatA, partial [Methylocystaceae bacterium]
MELWRLTAHEVRDLLAQKEIKASELVDSVYQRIDQVESGIQAYITQTRELAYEQAKQVDQGSINGPLAGIPGALKDNMCTQGVLTTSGSQILHNFIPPYDATVVSKFKREGIPILGKLNMDEFAMGSSTENSGYFTTKNPWDLTRVPGGSSGGAAAAVAAGEAFFSLGSDTGGSIRQPAAFCGVVGIKPTYGRVSRYGLMAYASSLDQIGSLARDVEDCALALNLIAGYDPLDSTSVNQPVPDYTSFLNQNIKGMHIGYPRELFGKGIESPVRDAIMQALKKMEQLGAVVEETSLPHCDYALAAYYILAPAECSANLGRFDGVRYGLRDEEADNIIDMYSASREQGFGPEVKRRIMLGTYALSSGYYDAYYLKALKVRRLDYEDFQAAFAKYDVLVSPTAPSVAFKLGDRTENVLAMYMS